METLHRETNFEHYITRKLTEMGESGDWVISQNDKGFDPNTALIMDDFIAYQKAISPEKIEKMEKSNPEHWRGNLEKALVSALERDGTVYVLRNGFQMAGYQTITCSGHYPDDPRLDSLKKAYNANILRAMHQVHYQTAGNKSLDLVFFVNGIAVATAEIKTDFTQSVQDAILEYQNERRPVEPGTKRKNPLLAYKRGAVVHFAISEDEIYMCTNLEPKMPHFLPFNRGDNGHAGNPPMKDGDNDYPTGYFWNDILKRENWIRIFHDFIFEEVSKKEDAQGRLKDSYTQIFPRYHQWHCVTSCINDVKANGVGQRYLIEHSAGSGKTETISWTAHELINVRDTEGNKLFSSVIVVTDRVGLDSNIKNTIKQLRRLPGLIAMIGGEGDKRSASAKNKELAQALHEKREIIVVTLQTFPYALDTIAKDTALTGCNFAVLIDEAHSSQTGSFAGKMKTALKLAAKEKKKENPLDQSDVTDEEIINAYFQNEQSNREMPKNVSFFAYTATPKAETKELFGRPSNKIDEKTGRPIPVSFDLYPMRQAIEEGFIIDVIKGYMPYQTAYRIKEDSVPDEEVDKTRAIRTIAHWESLHPTNVMEKTEFIIEHFVKNVAPMLNGQAKAMIVTSSRPAVIRYKYAIEAYLRAHPEYNADKLSEALRFKAPGDPLVAFSGVVHGKDAIMAEDEYLKDNPFAAIKEDYDYTEENANNTGYETVENAFDKPQRRLMIVCNKFQTGFDQPKLCAMYIDKSLANDIEIVQTYSRVNRIYPGKDRVFILDFVNDPETVVRAFKKYDSGAMMEHAQKLEVVYELKQSLDDSEIYSQSDFESYKKARYAAIAKGPESISDEVRKKLYQCVMIPAERWNSKMKAHRTGYANWKNAEKKAERVKNSDMKQTAEVRAEDELKEIDKLLTFRKDLKKFVHAYEYISQIVDFGDPDLEVYDGFAAMLSKQLEDIPVDDIDVSRFIMSDYSIRALTVESGDNDEPAVLRPMNGNGSAKAQQKESLKKIVHALNEAWGTDVSAVDGARTVNAIVDSVNADDVSRLQIRNSTNSKEAVISDGRLESIIKIAALSLKENDMGRLAEKIISDPQAMKPIEDMIYDLVYRGRHLDIPKISEYEKQHSSASAK